MSSGPAAAGRRRDHGDLEEWLRKISEHVLSEEEKALVEP